MADDPHDEARLRLAQTYHRVFGTPEGRTVLQHLREVFMEQERFVPGDPYHTHVRVGEGRVIQHMDAMLRYAANPQAALRVVDTTDDPREAA